MPSAGFEPAIPAGERLQTLALDRSASGIGRIWLNIKIESSNSLKFSLNINVTEIKIKEISESLNGLLKLIYTGAKF